MVACPLCGTAVDQRVLVKSATLRPALLPLLWQEQPGWQPQQGLCPACAHRLMRRLIAARSATSLHITTDPHTTFPYYHASEERILSQAERLPDYVTFAGDGVTVAFLDSGYYPHPDLCTDSTWSEPAPDWATLDEDQWRIWLKGMQPRIAQYADLADGSERIGVDQPSLWDGAGTSWHGQMTTTIAAGNGYLSRGHFRGYAAQASILPIKIGRQDGRIPEADILRGLQWLLHDDNWQRYRVRVLNVSVGGDYRQPWQRNSVCLAAEELSRRGVLICAAAGNRGAEGLVAPAQAPSVLTVGGYEDHNQRWQPHHPATFDPLTLYHHNYGTASRQRQRTHKPEILALGRWLPAPILPVSPVFMETVTIARLRNALLGYDEELLNANSLLSFRGSRQQGTNRAGFFPVIWQALRQQMNVHKWIHPYYQHVDGTSVAVAQVSGAAAQVFAANPALTGPEVRTILLETASPLPQQPVERVGQGVLQPGRAVAAALRARGGRLQGYPHSATLLDQSEWQQWLAQNRAPVTPIHDPQAHTAVRPIYLGYYAPAAAAVSVVGDFTGWQPGAQPLTRTDAGWWHGILLLAAGQYCYRFWVEAHADSNDEWTPDPENPRRGESGYWVDHSLLVV